MKEKVSLTKMEEADALNREDELGKLVLCAFSFVVPPLNALKAGASPDNKKVI